MAKAKRTKASASLGEDLSSSVLLALPEEVLHQVLDMLSADDLRQLMQTSKVMAAEVLQHSAGKIIYKVKHHSKSMAAVRALLLWAPPACLKLGLHGSVRTAWSSFRSLFQISAQPSFTSEALSSPQFLCIVQVSLRDVVLHGLVPARLAALCPNMHTLQLHSCTVEFRTQDISKFKKVSGNAACSSSSSCSHVLPATRMRTLVLEYTEAPQLKDRPQDRKRVTRNMSSVASYMDQLRSRLPNLTCLKLVENCSDMEFMPALGPQLTELHIAQHSGLQALVHHGVLAHLQQLQKLVLPGTRLYSNADVDQLLSLPHVTHLEFGSVAKQVTKDYSSLPCKWQYLHLHPSNRWLSIDALARLPLHSLTHPLTLENKPDENILLELTSVHGQQDPAGLQRLASRLTHCGARVLGGRLAWSGGEIIATVTGIELAPAVELLAPAFGLQESISLSYMTVDKPIFETLAAVYGSSLQTLVLSEFEFPRTDMRSAWNAAVKGLPALHKVHWRVCYTDAAKWIYNAQCLATAMQQQPAGRTIKLIVADTVASTPEEFALQVRNGLSGQEQLTALSITAKRQYRMINRQKFRYYTLAITRNGI